MTVPASTQLRGLNVRYCAMMRSHGRWSWASVCDNSVLTGHGGVRSAAPGLVLAWDARGMCSLSWPRVRLRGIAVLRALRRSWLQVAPP